MNKDGGINLIGMFILISVSFLLGFIFYSSIIGLHIIITENGEHTGYVTAIETNGIFFKTTSVYFKTDAESTQEDRYCVIDKDLVEELRKYQSERKLITIKFYDVISYGWKNCKVEDIGIISGI